MRSAPRHLVRLTVFGSALLLFLVQPMFARMVLPRLGGSAQVWNTCVLFFQAALLAGYGYAHFLARRPGWPAQVTVHVLLVLGAAAVLPISIAPDALPPSAGSPVPWLLALLTVTLGLPFLALAATAPLIQSWYVRSEQRDAGDPYFFYAASNAGSLSALVAYPFLVEPFLTLGAQSWAWTVAYGIFVSLLVLSAVALRRARSCDDAVRSREPDLAARRRSHLAESESDPGRWGATSRRAGSGRMRLPRSALRWLVLSSVPASLMLGVTAHMTHEVPSLPLLWVLPLALYLLSFTLVFAQRPPIPHRWMVAVQPLLLAILALILFMPARLPAFTVHLAAFFVTAMVLHGELARHRPHPRRLTVYYFCIATGGVLGGAFNALLAPVIFPLVLEYPLAVVAACLVSPRPGDREASKRGHAADLLAPAALGVIAVAVVLSLPLTGDARDVAARVGVLFIAASVAFSLRRRSLRFGLAVGAVLLAGFCAFRLPGTVHMARSYYGTYRIARVPGSERDVLFHGTTIHGAQDHSLPDGHPVSYFHPDSPIGTLLRSRAEALERIAVIGLGVGALAWYTEPGQHLRYFEIDPLVEELARDTRYFTYLASARGQIDVVLGDGRLRIAHEPDGRFDLVIADAFSSDAVPVHLLTREALRLYLDKAAAHGALVLNVANRHLRLDRVVAALARDLGVAARTCMRPVLAADALAAGRARARWVLITRSELDLERWLGDDPCWSPLPDPGNDPAWTDHYTSLLPFLDW